MLENFLECYHCGSCHSEYIANNPSAYHFENGNRGERFRKLLDEWTTRMEKNGQKTGIEMMDLGSNSSSEQSFGCFRVPLEPGFSTQSQGGKPVAPLMGSYVEYDGGETACGVGPLSAVLSYSDYAVLFQFLPMGALQTSVEVSWLVAEDAREGADFDVQSLTWLWDVTTQQDEQITVRNQLGVNSRFYRPGPYSEGEPDTAQFTNWYLSQIA